MRFAYFCQSQRHLYNLHQGSYNLYHLIILFKIGIFK
nr:MAG TPA: hypothetical protein [Caudoviricetes sp.]